MVYLTRECIFANQRRVGFDVGELNFSLILVEWKGLNRKIFPLCLKLAGQVFARSAKFLSIKER